jgi:N-acetylmuramoyl-L-alanine amidase
VTNNPPVRIAKLLLVNACNRDLRRVAFFRTAPFLLFLVILAVLSPLTSAGKEAENHVNNVRIWHSPDKTRVVFDVSKNIKHTVFSLKKPERLVVDIENAELRAAMPKLDIENRHLKVMRSGAPKQGVLRFVFELKAPLEAHSFVLSPNELYGHRLVVDLIDLESKSDVQAEASSDLEADIGDSHVPSIVTSETLRSSSTPETSLASVAVKSSETSLGSVSAVRPEDQIQSIDQIPDSRLAEEAESIKSKKVLVVAIDAGHGGEDPGATGHRGSREKVITLSIAKHLKKVIKADSRMDAFLIRQGDYYIDLTRRRTMAREQGADIFVSIHADAFTKKSANGLSVFALSQRGATSAMARALAKKENSADLIGGVSLANKDAVLQKVLVDLSITNTISESVNLGGRVLKELGKVGRLHSKRVEQAAFVVLKSPDIPSILIETGFITNLNEEKKLRTRKYQKKIANAIYMALGEYYEQTPYQNYANYSSRRVASSSRSDSESQAKKTHLVKRGDSLSSIAANYGTTVAELKRINGLRKNTAVLGKKLKLPTATAKLNTTRSSGVTSAVHIVKRGESLSKISARYNVTISALKRANNLTKDSVITSQKIIIPGHRRVKAPRTEIKYKVSRGDTLSEIAERHGVTMSAIIKANRLTSDGVKLGQTLKIPG